MACNSTTWYKMNLMLVYHFMTHKDSLPVTVLLAWPISLTGWVTSSRPWASSNHYSLVKSWKLDLFRVFELLDFVFWIWEFCSKHSALNLLCTIKGCTQGKLLSKDVGWICKSPETGQWHMLDNEIRGVFWLPLLPKDFEPFLLTNS